MQERRKLFRWILGGTATVALGWPGRKLDAMSEAVSLQADEAWLTNLASKKQKAFIDVRGFSLEGTPFRRSLALLTALTTAYGLSPNDVGIAVGPHSAGLAHLLSRKFWTDYDVADKVAKSLRPDDAAAIRKLGVEASTIGADGVRDLKAKGIYVLACRNTIARWSRDIAAARNETPEAVQAKILANLHPGVEPVPAMIASAVLAQARGLSYVAIE